MIHKKSYFRVIKDKTFAAKENMATDDALLSLYKDGDKAIFRMYSWEKSFIGVIGSYRSKEMTSLKRIAYLIAGSRAYMYMVPAVVSLLSLSTYALIGGDVNPRIIFAALAAFNQVSCS